MIRPTKWRVRGTGIPGQPPIQTRLSTWSFRESPRSKRPAVGSGSHWRFPRVRWCPLLHSCGKPACLPVSLSIATRLPYVLTILACVLADGHEMLEGV